MEVGAVFCTNAYLDEDSPARSYAVKNTMKMMKAKPIMSVGAKKVPRNKALVTVAEAIALASILTIESPEKIAAAREEYVKSTGGKYICPVGMDAKPELEHV